ncbi:hypothetical protein BJ684DRAFT_3144, partial [Piptocephalis cylindrospora]
GSDMDSPLVDPEGFPRADVDVIQVRQLRVSMIETRNDLRLLMRRIEQGLHDLHSTSVPMSTATAAPPSGPMPQSVTSLSPDASSEANEPASSHERRAFARVASLSPDSPAWEAGLKKEDTILQFGHVHSENH